MIGTSNVASANFPVFRSQVSREANMWLNFCRMYFKKVLSYTVDDILCSRTLRHFCGGWCAFWKTYIGSTTYICAESSVVEQTCLLLNIHCLLVCCGASIRSLMSTERIMAIICVAKIVLLARDSNISGFTKYQDWLWPTYRYRNITKCKACQF